MFSFGLFLGNGPAVQPFLQNGRTKRVEIPEVVPPSVRSSLASSWKDISKVWSASATTVGARTDRRHLLEVFPENSQNEEIRSTSTASTEYGKNLPQQPDQRSTQQHQHKITINEKQSKQQKKSMPMAVGEQSTVGDSHKRKLGELEETESNEMRTNIMAEFMNETSPSNISHLSDNAELSHFFSERLKQRPNTAFFTCEDFHQIIPPSLPRFDPNSPLYLSLLVPARSLPHQGRVLSSEDTTEDTAIEITCQFVGVNHTNFELPPVAVSA